MPREVERGRWLGHVRRRVDRTDRTHQAIAVPERDQAPGLAPGAAGEHACRRFAPAVFGVEAGPRENRFRGRFTARPSRADATLGVEPPAPNAARFEPRALLVSAV